MINKIVFLVALGRAISVPAVVVSDDSIELATVETAFDVKGMHCATCPLTVRVAAKSVRGVVDARVSLEQARAWVVYDPAQTDADAIAAAITKAGYPAKPVR